MVNVYCAAVPSRPLGATELLDTAVRTVWSLRATILPITVPVTVVVTGLAGLVRYAGVGDSAISFAGSLLTLLISVFAGTVLAGLIAPAVAPAPGGAPTAGATIRATGLRIFPLVLLGVVVTVAEGAGLVALLVGGVFLWGVWAVCAPAFAIERLGPIEALRRSFRLVRGDFWRVWGVRALGRIVTTVVGLVAGVPFGALAYWVAGVHSFGDAGQYVERPGLFTAVVTLGSLIGGLITTPVSATIDVLLYLDLRMRREGMDIVMGLPQRTAVS